jgi:glutathione S-transferase
MIVVHHLNNSRSQRVLWLLEELEIPYEVKRYERDPVTMLAPKSLRDVHPLGKSPVVTDDGLTIAESGAIVEYLVEKYGGGRIYAPEGTPERLRCRYWLHYAEGSLMPLLLLKLVFNKLEESPMPFFIRPIAKGISAKVNAAFTDPQLKMHLDFVEGELTKSPWLAGEEITVADIQMSFPLEGARDRGGLDARRPKTMAFLDKIQARPAYKRALERGGPYAFAKS